MGRVTWTEPALAEVQKIADYVARDSHRNAIRLYERLLRAPDALTQLPLSGGIVADFKRVDLREILVRPYRIIYRVTGNDCLILTVIHGSRRLTSAFQLPEIGFGPTIQNPSSPDGEEG